MPSRFHPEMAEAYRAAAGRWCCNGTFYWLSLLVNNRPTFFGHTIYPL